MKLSALAQHLADRIAAAPRQKIEFEMLYHAAVAFDRSLATAPTARGEVRAALDELVTADLVVLPAAAQYFDRRDAPPLPMWVRRPPRERVVREAKAVRVWPAVLESAGRIADRADEIDLLVIVAGFLRDGGATRPIVPMRERSIELFDDEKRLDRLVSTRLFTSGALTPDLLRCRSIPVPFVSQWVPGSHDPRGTALLIAENHHTYVSVLEVTRHRAGSGGPGRHVGYGTGNQFPSAVLSVPLLEPKPARIIYFGDVDLNGVTIPASASAASTSVGLPPVVPAYPLYELLFKVSRGRPAVPVPTGVAAEAARWLGPLADQAHSLMVNGIRLPQETVGHELLMDRHDDLDRV